MTGQASSLRPSRIIRVSGERRSAFDRARDRLFALMVVFTALFVVVIGRLFMLTVVEARHSVSPISVLAQIPRAPRADVIDRNGVTLAKSMPSRSLIVKPAELLNMEEAIAQVRTVLPDLSASYLRERMAPGAHFRYIKRHITPAQEAYLRGVGDPGLQFEDEFRRVYPSGSLAAHVVGFADADGQGRLGIEASFNRRLNDEKTRDNALRLSIDARIQHAMESVIQQDIRRYQAEAGIGILMHIATGEVLAMASLPVFDPNNVVASPMGYQANRATNRTYELGSTFKAFTYAQGFELGITRPDRVCDAARPLILGAKKVEDRWSLRKPITMAQALIRSSNTCTGRLGDAIGAKRQREFLRSLGFLSPLSIELNERSVYHMSSGWGRFATITISYGHGIAVTPLHLAQGAATLLNDGRPVQATLIPQNPVMKDGIVEESAAMISPETGSTIRQLLRLTVLNGTGKAADVAGLRVGGKTGTAERARKDALGYEEDKNITTFLGAFPMEAPEYVVVMILDSPKAEADSLLRGASANVAGTAGRFIRRASPFLGVMPKFSPETWLDEDLVQNASFEVPKDWGAVQ